MIFYRTNSFSIIELMEVRIRFSWFFIIVFFHLLKCVIVNKEFLLKKMRPAKKTKHPPAFDHGMSLRVRAIKGTVAFLTCIVKNLENESVSWIRSQDLHILTVNHYVFTGDSRFHIIHENAENWTLKLDDVRLDDNGIYECQISTQPVTSFSVYLSVSAVADSWASSIKSREKEQKGFDLINDDVTTVLSKPQPNLFNTKIVEGSEKHLGKGNPLQLTCEVRINIQFNESVTKIDWANVILSNLVWLHNNKILNRYSSHEGTSVKTTLSSINVVLSKLKIWRTLSTDSGEYICRPLMYHEAVTVVYIINGQTRTYSSSIVFTSILFLHGFIRSTNL